jgi:hypothetical protein
MQRLAAPAINVACPVHETRHVESYPALRIEQVENVAETTRPALPPRAGHGGARCTERMNLAGYHANKAACRGSPQAYYARVASMGSWNEEGLLWS